MILNEELVILVSYLKGRRLLNESIIFNVSQFLIHILSKVTTDINNLASRQSSQKYLLK